MGKRSGARRDIVAVGSGTEFKLQLVTHYSLKPNSTLPLDKYRDYIKSAHWVARRQLYYEKYSKECAVCFSSAEGIELNHAFYGDLGQERDEDLMPFCREHHQLFHDRYGVKFNMREECQLFIYEERKRLLQYSHGPIVSEVSTSSATFASVIDKLASPAWRVLSLLGVNRPGSPK